MIYRSMAKTTIVRATAMTAMIVAAFVVPSFANSEKETTVSERFSFAGNDMTEKNKFRLTDEIDGAVESLPRLLETAFENSPRVSEARHMWLAALETRPVASSLPDPVLSFYFPSLIRDNPDAALGRIGVEQMFERKGARRAAGEAAAAASEIALLNYEIAVRDTIAATKDSYAELAYLQTAISLTRSAAALVESLSEASERDYAANAIPLRDLLRAQSQRALLGYDLILLEEQRLTEAAKLNATLGREAGAPIVVGEIYAAAPAAGLDELYEIANASRQETLAARAAERKALADRNLAKEMSRPMYGAGLMYNKAQDGGMGGAGGDSVELMVEMTLPVWRSRNRAMVNESEHMRNAASEMTREQTLMAESTINELYYRIKTNERLVVLYTETLLPQARKTMEISESYYNAGRASFAELLETRSVWLNFELALARARTDLYQNVGRLERAVGAALPVKGME